tara:strand:- start:567 stop:1622 length:1056 start_codon:yes stop_codon:yes gene_type:complete
VIFKNRKKPHLIAEISANHCGSLNLAKKLILSAKKNGADAVKIQTFTPDSMTLKSTKNYFKIKNGIWKGFSYWDLYNKAKTPLEWHKELFAFAKKNKIQIFSSPFDENAVDFLEKLNCPIYKVASFEMTDLSLIKKISKTNKPIIISTGLANLKEIELAYNAAKKNGSKEIILMYCVSSYPSKLSDFNLNNIKILKKIFNCRVGLSDHSNDNRIAEAAIASGADIIEKHIALKNQKNGLDIKFSLKDKEIRNFKNRINFVYNLLGKNIFFRSSNEKKNKIFRRSIFATKNIKKGEKFSTKNIRRIRPGYGLSPIYYPNLINKISPQKFMHGDPIKKNILKKLRIKKIKDIF